MSVVYIALGSNLGPSCATLQKALSLLGKLGNNLKASSFHQTEPEECEGGAFTNAVCSFETDLDPVQLFRKMEEIETLCGKKPKGKQEAREIDLDLLFYGDKRYNFFHLRIPHPRWHERLFVITPLRELTQTICLENEVIHLNILEEALLCRQ